MRNNTFVAIDPDPIHLGLVKTFIAKTAILRGAVVSFHDTGVSREVIPATSSTGTAIGVALNSQATVGGEVTVAMQGSVIKVMVSTDNVGIDAGHWVTSSAIASCVVELDPVVSTHVAGEAGFRILGYTIDDITAGALATGYIVINVMPRWSLSA
jgi:hypothetical protein